MKSSVALNASMWEPQRLRSRNAVNSEPQRLRNKNNGNASPGNSNGAVDANTWKRQNQGIKAGGDCTSPGSLVDGSMWEPQRLRSKNTTITSPAKPDARVDANTWEHQGTKRLGGNNTAYKREAKSCDTQGGKTTKMDATWQRSLGNVRVHIRDLGMKVGGGGIRKDLKKEHGKVVGKAARVKTRS